MEWKASLDFPTNINMFTHCVRTAVYITCILRVHPWCMMKDLITCSM